MALAEFEDGDEFEGIAQCVGHHDGLRFARAVGGLQQRAIGVAGLDFGIDENRHCTALDDGSNGGWKTGGYGDHFIAFVDTFVLR